jgi:hypothetical protein
MTMWSNVHLMFCEGPHDAAFLNRLLKKQLNFKKIELKISDLPYPISNVIQMSFKTRAADDLRLDLAKKFFLPDYLVVRDSVIVMIFNYGGSNRKKTMEPFLENVFALLGAPAFSGTGQLKNDPKFSYSVFADADTIGLAGARTLVSNDLATIGGIAWLSNAWIDYKETKAVSQESAYGPVAAYVWKKWAEDNGTLEDSVLECLADDPGLKQTLNFLDSRFNWTPHADAKPDHVCATAAKRLKAAFCVEGQREKPGMSLGVVLDQTELLTSEIIAKSVAVQDCLSFLRTWLIPVRPALAAALETT